MADDLRGGRGDDGRDDRAREPAGERHEDAAREPAGERHEDPGDERRDEERVPTPIAWEPARSEEELRAEQRDVPEVANSEAAIRAVGVVGALGGNVPIGSGGIMSRGGALGIEETDREADLDERVDLDRSDRAS
jgi:hypothetical protein